LIVQRSAGNANLRFGDAFEPSISDFNQAGSAGRLSNRHGLAPTSLVNQITAFGHAGTIICKRVPSRVERGDCLFHLADDFVP
jgi:hypothetical protein